MRINEGNNINEHKKSINLLLITNLFPNPIDPTRGIFTLQLVKKLKLFYNVTIISPLPWFPKLSIFRIFKKWHSFSLIPENYSIEGIDVYSPRYFMIPFVSEPFHGILMFFGLFRMFLKLEKKSHFDIINTHWLYPDGVSSSWIARIRKLPIVLSALGSDINVLMKQLTKKIQILDAVNKSSAIITVSSDLKNILLQEGIPDNKITVIKNGVDTDIFFPRKKYECLEILSLPADKKIILFVGRLDKIKGVIYLIDAVDKIIRQRDDLMLIVIGEGPLRSSYINTVMERNLQNNVKFIGGKAHHEIAIWMGACDIFCLPSIKEGCPNVVLEALASGRPVVASKVGGIPEIVNEKNGVLVEPENSQNLSKALIFALENQWSIDKICQSVAHLSWDKAAESYCKVFEKIYKFHNLHRSVI